MAKRIGTLLAAFAGAFTGVTAKALAKGIEPVDNLTENGLASVLGVIALIVVFGGGFAIVKHRFVWAIALLAVGSLMTAVAADPQIMEKLGKGLARALER